MTATEFVELFLTCGSWQEAQKIADGLLEKHLVACVEFMEINSKFLWHGELDSNKEIKLVMHSVAALFDKVEAEVKQLHSYQTFVLLAVPATKVSRQAKQWLTKEIKEL